MLHLHHAWHQDNVRKLETFSFFCFLSKCKGVVNDFVDFVLFLCSTYETWVPIFAFYVFCVNKRITKFNIFVNHSCLTRHGHTFYGHPGQLDNYWVNIITRHYLNVK